MMRERRCGEERRRGGSLKRQVERERTPETLMWAAGVVEIDAQVPVPFLG